MALAPSTQWGDISGPPGPPGPTGPEGPQGPLGALSTDCGVFKSLASEVSLVSFTTKIDESPVLDGGTYYIFWTARYNGTNPNTHYELRLELAAVEIDLLFDNPVGETTVCLTWSSFDFVDLDQGVNTFKLQHRQPSGSGILNVSHFKLGYILIKPLVIVQGGGGPG